MLAFYTQTISMPLAKYLVLDTEATGLLPGIHGLIQLAGLALDEQFNTVDSLNFDIKPPQNTVIEPAALEINGFTLERINQGVSYQETAERLLSFLEKHFVQEPIMIGQFYPADYAMLVELCKQTGALGRKLHERLGNNFLDTKVIVNLINLKAQEQGLQPPFPVVSLSKPGGIKEVLGLQNYLSHDAMGDVLATREVLLRLFTLIDLKQ